MKVTVHCICKIYDKKNIVYVSLVSDLSANLDDYEVGKSLQVTSILSESKHWIVVQLPVAYMATNWPIRVSR